MPALLDGLNASQRGVVAHTGGPLLVVAGPGTGKTRTLTERYAWLVEQGTAAECVLAITFSEPAAAAMRAALEDLLDRPYEELNVHTFHSFCVQLLQDEALEAGVDPFFSPVTPADRLALLLDRIDELSLRHHEIRGNPAPLLGSFVSRIDRLKEEMVSAEEVRAWAEQLPMDTDAARAHNCREREFARLYRDHDRLLAERGALDYGDLVLRAFRLLHECPHVRERTARRFRHLLVDEYQEATRAQRMLLHLLADEHEGLTVVAGDDRVADELPSAEIARLDRNVRSGRRILDAAAAVNPPPRRVTGASGGRVRFWRCRSERAQAQAVAAEVERLLDGGVPPEEVCVLVRSVKSEAAVVAAALEERAVPFRTCGAAAYFQRAEVRDVLAWLRALADPNDSGAVVRALSRPPIELRSVDVARLTQLARRRKLDMPSAVAAALEGPQLSEEGRDRARAFLRLYRSASAAFEDRRPDAFVMRLIERIGVRRQQVFATHADTVERLRNIAKLPELATAYMRREPQATARDFARYLAAVAESGLREDEAVGQPSAPAVPVMTMQAARGLEFDHVFVLGLSAAAMPGPYRPRTGDVPDELRRSPRPDHELEMRRLLHLAMTRARKGLVLAWPEEAQRPSPFYEEARAAVDVEEELFEEELFGPAEGLHSTFRLMRDELLDTVARVGGRLGEMRLDTYLDVDQAMARYLELIKVAALIERAREGQPLEAAL
ncbi:MAG TPA: ATP-dependent helicase, partial [Thermoleophilaceae bacterium]|nr:ATP-dependent helicase [Thermoleophilaceae bacterium]